MPATRLTPTKTLVPLSQPTISLIRIFPARWACTPLSPSFHLSRCLSHPVITFYNNTTSEQDHKPIVRTNSVGNSNPIIPLPTQAPLLPRPSYLSLQVVPTTTQALISLIYLVGRFVHPSPAYTSRPRTYHQIHTRRDLHLSAPRNEKQTFSIPSQRPGRAPHQVATSLGISRSTILAAPLPPYHTSPSHDIQVHRQIRLVPDCTRLCQIVPEFRRQEGPASQPPPLHRSPFIAGSWIILSPLAALF
ncbi:uncharacterized protein B0T23DRAFT_23093 [Neurospora hispaniola]|uniref:Uncharacterized protein n=1 Tax=Neurospora hispaniola TaxID=588809 RepID=A0AAJ0IGY7_9PEZI|nr:hypothetical protein B0T23DRAFT_23093 [Neurospora hispaniola]